MRSRMTREVLVIEDMELGDIFPVVGVVGCVPTETLQPRKV